MPPYTRHVYPPNPFIEPGFRASPAGLTDKERRSLLAGPVGEVFTFQDDKIGATLVFNIEALKQDIAANHVPYQVGACEVDLAAYLIWMKNGGIEEDHLKTLSKSRLLAPIIYCIFPDKEWVLLDGVHRAVARFRAGHYINRAVVLHYPYWRRYLVDLATAQLMDAEGNPVDLLGLNRLRAAS